MSARPALRASRQRAAARKRMRLGQLQARFRFKHRHTFDDFWGEQLLDLDIADTAFVVHAAERAGTAAFETGRA
jgi:hypothetical protein